MIENLVSIITPAYNCANYIGTTIESVLSQTYSYWEMIIVDDCSSDNTEEVVLRYASKDSRIKYKKLEVNSGAAITRNNALRRAQGRWIAFLDSDDLWYPEKLERQVEFMLNCGYHFSYTGYCEINEQTEETGKIVSGPRRITKLGMFAFCWPGCLTVMYDRDYVGPIQIADIKKNNDYAMWLEICRKVDCYLLDECLAKYRRGRSGSISTHGYSTLIKWHYKLFRDGEKMNVISALFFTGVNLLCGIYKKIRYVKTKR